MSPLHVLVVVTVLLGVTVARPQVAAPPCCIPAQWEGGQNGVSQTVAGGVSTIVRTANAVSYDYTNRREALFVNTTTSQGVFTRQFMLALFKEGTEYVLDLDSRKCTKMTMPSNVMPGCIPDTAKVERMVEYGLNQLPATEYAFMVGGFSVSLSVTDKCVPIVQTVAGSSGPTSVVQAQEYANIVPGIKNPDVFNVPKECITAHEELPSEHRVRTFLG